MARPFFLIMLLSISAVLYAQPDYVKLNDGTMLRGFTKSYVSYTDGQRGIELWETKKDKNPAKIAKADISEYSLNKKRYKFIRGIQPFPSIDEYYDEIEGEVISKGEVSLYFVADVKDNGVAPVVFGAAGGIVAGIIVSSAQLRRAYVLQNAKTGYTEGLPKDWRLLREALRNFYPDEYIDYFARNHFGTIKYKLIPEFVATYKTWKAQ